MNEPSTNTTTFEQLYLRERKKAYIFMTISVILAILLAGVLLYGLTKKPDQPGAMRQGGAGMMGPGMTGSGGGGKVIMPSDSVADYLNGDGSVNMAAIEARVGGLQAPPEMLQSMLAARERQIDDARAAGEITAQQATDLKEAWRKVVGGAIDAN